MNKTLIALKGTANVGKSMTLSKLGRKIRAAGGLTNEEIDRREYWAIFDYKNSLIGIQTYGDHVNDVSAGIKGFLQRQCDVIISASKIRGATINHLSQIAITNSYRLLSVRPIEVNDGSIDIDTIKDYGADQLLIMIDDIIAGNL